MIELDEPPGTPLTDALRARLAAGIPVPPPSAAETRWREVLVAEADRLTAAAYPLDAMAALRAPNAIYWSEVIQMEGRGAEDGSKPWSMLCPISRRLLPRAGLAHLFGAVDPTNPLRGAHVVVPHGHRVWVLYRNWRACQAERQVIDREARCAFSVLLGAASTVEQVVAAWPGAADVLRTAPATPPEHQTLEAASAQVRAVLTRMAAGGSSLTLQDE